MKKNRRHIAFIGDSFCATYDQAHYLANDRPRWQAGTNSPAWPSLVADRFNLIPDYHGYMGKSWWYSRNKFYHACQHLLVKHQYEVIVFCHTDYTRMNTRSEPLINVMNPVSEEEKMLHKAQDLWKGYLYDPMFQQWCQNFWLTEIKQVFKHVPKIIQFSNFYPDLFTADLCLGMCYRTPLIWIQIGEHAGSEKHIWKQLASHVTANHFNDENNIKMADFIVEAITNYRPGIYDIDLAKFNRVNLNASNWVGMQPKGFGTE